MKLTGNARAFLFSRGLKARGESAQLFAGGFELLLGLHPLGDVLRDAERPAGAALFVAEDVALAMDEAHLAVGTHHAVFHTEVLPRPHRLVAYLLHPRAVIRVDELQGAGECNGLLWRQPENAVVLVRTNDAPRVQVMLVVSDVSDALRVLQSALALLQGFLGPLTVFDIDRHPKPF